MNELKNLMLWFDFDEDGNIDRLTKIDAISAKFDLDAYFELWRVGTDYRAENTYTFTKEHIVVPERLMGVEGVAFIMHTAGKRHRAILPYFVTIQGDEQTPEEAPKGRCCGGTCIGCPTRKTR